MACQLPAILNTTINPANLTEEIWKVMKHIRPEWSEDSTHIEMLGGGFINKLVGVTSTGDGHKEKGVVLRIWADSPICGIDRDREVAAMMAAYRSGCGPQVFAVFQNGVAMKYIRGKLLKWDDLRDPTIARKVGRAIAQFQYVDTKDPLIIDRKGQQYAFRGEPILFQTLKQGLSRKLPNLKDKQRNIRYHKEIKSFEEYQQEIEYLERHLVLDKYEKVLCHFDFWPANLMRDEHEDCIYILDCEFSDTGYNMFDLGSYLGSLPTMMQMGLEEKTCTMLDDTVCSRLLRSYLQCRAEIKGGNPADVTDHDVTEALRHSKKWATLGYLYWTLATFADYESTDLDYLEIGIMMQTLYFSGRHLLFSSSE